MALTFACDPIVGVVAHRSSSGVAHRISQPRALSAAERAEVLGVLHADRFVDQAPASIYATLLDDGRYLCSVPTMYRLLRAEDEVRERRRQATHPARIKPELVASGPNTVWSWDITKLLGPEKWTYFHLYVVIDIYSRYVTGWLLATRETAELAERLLGETIRKQHVEADQLTIHADRGTSMASKTVALLLADLGVTKSHSRPHCSNDNPVLRGALQNPQVPTGVPWTVRLDRGRPRVLPALLPLVQPRAPPFWHRLPHPGRCALRSRWPGPARASPRPASGLRGAPRTLRPPGACPASSAGTSLDQQTRGGPAAHVIVQPTGLTRVDSFRRQADANAAALAAVSSERRISPHRRNLAVIIRRGAPVVSLFRDSGGRSARSLVAPLVWAVGGINAEERQNDSVVSEHQKKLPLAPD